MAAPKKGQLKQFMVPMVDATDFASVESAITESDFNSGATVKFFGVDNGTSAAFTSGTVSKTARLVKSGVFQIVLKGTENNYDEMMVRINKTGCAEQIITWGNVDNDDSDIMSALTVIQSMASDAASAAAQGNSRVLLVQSRVSDAQSMLSDFYSDFQSRVPKAVATNSQLSDLHSDLRSYLVGISSMESDLYSQLSDFRSDLASLITTTGVQINASSLSDIRSAIAANTPTLSASDISDIASAVAAAVTTVTASDISDIASAVRAILVSDLSDILSAAQQTNSRALVNQSRVSDIQSFLSDFQSDLISHLDTTGVQLNASSLSDLRSAIAATELDASDLSDIASAVRAVVSSDLSDIISAVAVANSRVLLNQSRISDVYSALSDLQSDFQSRVPKAVATNSQLSDLHSDLRSVLIVMSGIQSDIYSAIAAGVEIGASSLSDIRSAIVAATDGLKIAKNTALAAFEFVMVLSSDHVTGATGKTVTATRSIDGAAFAACANSVSEVSNGVYKIDLAAGDLNGDVVTLRFTATDCDARIITIFTQSP